MKTIVFRTMGGIGIGYGHFFRCYSLAKALKYFNKNLRVIFIINKELKDQLLGSEFEYLISESFEKDATIIEELKPQLFILDSYLSNNDYFTKVKKTTKLMIFDDNNDIYDSTIPDILLNGNIHAEGLDYKKNKNSLYLLGPKYLVMKEEYWQENTFNYEDKNKNGILITTGGTDPYEVSYNILANIKELPYKKRVIIGPGYEDGLIKKLEKVQDEKIELIYKPKSLKEYIMDSRVSITSGGSTVYEILSQKTVPIIFSMADNQDRACESFAKEGVMYIGKHPQIEYDTINGIISRLMEEKILYSKEIFNLVDGKGVRRVLEVMEVV